MSDFKKEKLCLCVLLIVIQNHWYLLLYSISIYSYAVQGISSSGPLSSQTSWSGSDSDSVSFSKKLLPISPDLSDLGTTRVDVDVDVWSPIGSQLVSTPPFDNLQSRGASRSCQTPSRGYRVLW